MPKRFAFPLVDLADRVVQSLNCFIQRLFEFTFVNRFGIVGGSNS